MFFFITKCNNWSTTIALSKTVQKLAGQFNTPINMSIHQLVNVNQLVDSTYNQHVNSIYNQYVNSSPNKKSIQHTTNMLTQHTTKHVNVAVSKREPTCRFNIKPTRQRINVNQLVGSIHQLIAACTSLHCKSVQHNQHIKASAIYCVIWIQILNLSYCEQKRYH